MLQIDNLLLVIACLASIGFCFLFLLKHYQGKINDGKSLLVFSFWIIGVTASMPMMLASGVFLMPEWIWFVVLPLAHGLTFFAMHRSKLIRGRGLFTLAGWSLWGLLSIPLSIFFMFNKKPNLPEFSLTIIFSIYMLMMIFGTILGRQMGKHLKDHGYLVRS